MADVMSLTTMPREITENMLNVLHIDAKHTCCPPKAREVTCLKRAIVTRQEISIHQSCRRNCLLLLLPLLSAD